MGKLNRYNQMMAYLTRPPRPQQQETSVERLGMMAGGIPSLKFMIDFILKFGPEVSKVGGKISREFLEFMGEKNPQNILNVYEDVRKKLQKMGDVKQKINVPKEGDVKIGEAPKTDLKKVKSKVEADKKITQELADENQIPVKDQNVKSKYKFTGKETLDDLYDLEEKGIISRDDHNVYSERYLDYVDAQVKNKFDFSEKQMNDLQRQPARLNFLRAKANPNWAEANFGEDYLRILDKERNLEVSENLPQVFDEDTASDMAEFMKREDPEGFQKIQDIVDDINQKRELEDFDIKGRKPNAKGGLIGGGTIEGEDLGSRTGFFNPLAPYPASKYSCLIFTLSNL